MWWWILIVITIGMKHLENYQGDERFWWLLQWWRILMFTKMMKIRLFLSWVIPVYIKTQHAQLIWYIVWLLKVKPVFICYNIILIWTNMEVYGSEVTIYWPRWSWGQYCCWRSLNNPYWLTSSVNICFIKYQMFMVQTIWSNFFYWALDSPKYVTIIPCSAIWGMVPLQ